MRRPLEILTTLVLFAIGMAALSWAVNASVPRVDAWIVGLAGRAGGWAIFLGIMAVCAVIAWRGHRPAKGSAGRVDGTYPRARSD